MSVPPVPCTVAFDLDGTLIDSAPDLAGALNALLVECGRPSLPLSEVRTLVGDGAAALVRRGFGRSGGLDGTRCADLRIRFLELYAERMTLETRLFPGAEGMLEELRARGCRLVLCTNKPVGMTEAILGRLGIRSWFHGVVGGDSLPVRKPDPRPLSTAIERGGGTVRRAVMVGDSEVDVAAAKRAGVPSIAVRHGYSAVAADRLGADLVADRLADIPVLLVRLRLLGYNRISRSGSPVRARGG